MLVFDTIENLRQHLSSISVEKPIGFAPTMGALHKGHLSLISEAQKGNNTVVVSIFVNPTQFDNPSDLEKYPRTLKEDLRLLKNHNCDIVFKPNTNDIYNNNISSANFDFDGLENQMEGKFRKGHFDGVGTIVKRLFEIVNPTNAYFGEKDFQQLQIIKKLVEKNDMNVKIHGCKIYREKDGLAMSSRNIRLTTEQRMAAPFIYQTLKTAKNMFENHSGQEIEAWVKNEFDKNPLLSLEYFQIADEGTLQELKVKDFNKKYRAFIAINAGDIRLIDNINLYHKNN